MNEKELRKLLKQLEGAKLEFKSQMYQLEGQGRKTQWTELIKDIIALANGNLGTANEVGYLIIGASDQLGEDGIREIYDVGEVNLTQKQLLDKIGSFCITPLQDLNVETIPIDGKRIFIITIPPSDYLHELEKPLQTKTWEFSEGSVLLRRIDGEKIYKANDEERSRIRKEKQNRHRQQNSLYSKLTSYQHIKSEIEAGRFSELLETYSDALKPSLDDISEAERENLILVQATLRISEKIIKSDVNQLSSQLIGRLLSSQEPDIQKVLKEAEENQEEQERYWLKPLSASLQAPIASLRYSFKEGKQSIQAVAVDYRSDKLIAGFADGTLKIWHLNSGKSIKTWQGHNQQINHLTVTPDNTKIISISEDWILKIWNIIDCNLIYSSEVFQSEINSISVTSDSKKVVLAFEDAGIQVLSIPTRKFVTPAEIVNYPFEDALNNLVSTKDGKYIIFSEDTKIYMWEQDDNNIYLLGSHDGKVRDLILFSHHNFLLSISDDDSLKIWDLDHKMCQSVREGIFVRNVTITPDEESIIFSTDKGNQFQIWHWKRDKLDFFECDQESMSAMAIALAIKELLVVSVSCISGDEIYIYDWQIRKLLTKLSDHTGPITQLLVTQNEQFLISVSKDKTIKVWSLLKNQTTRALKKHISKVENILTTPDGEYTISTSEDSLNFWKTKEGKHLKTFPLRNTIDQIQTIKGKCIFSCANDIYCIQNIESSEDFRLFELGSHTSAVNDFILTSNGRYLISSSDDNDKTLNLKVWDLSSRTLNRSLEGHDEPILLVDINQENQWLVTASPRKTLIWSLEDFDLLYSFSGEHQAIKQLIRSINVNYKDKLFVSWDNTNLKICDLSSGQILYDLEDQKDQIEKVILISSDQKYLVFPKTYKDYPESFKLEIQELQSNLKYSLAQHVNTIESIAITNCNKYVISASSDSTLKVLSFENLSKPRSDNSFDQKSITAVTTTFIGDDGITACAVSCDNIIIAGEKTGQIHFLELCL